MPKPVTYDPRKTTDDSELQDILMQGYLDTAFYSKVFHPELFYAPFSSMHDQIYDILDHSDAKLIVIAGPRGIGKTAVMRGLLSKSIVYRMKHYIPYISTSATSAEMQTENLKMDLQSSEVLKKIFGNIKESAYDGSPDYFSKKTWIANGYTLVLPRGSGQQIRGGLWGVWRPDLFVIDDLEDMETIDNEVIRKARKDWFHTDVMEAVSRLKTDWRIIYIDTVKHEDALIVDLLEDPDWESLQLSICDEHYKTVDETWMPQVILDQKLKTARRKHQMDLFAMEHMAQPSSKEAAGFKASYFNYYKETDPAFIKRLPYIENLVIVDPARTALMHNSQSGIVVWGVDVESNALYVREARGEFYHPDELYDDVFKTAQRYNVRAIGLETTGLEEFILYPFKTEMHRRGLNYEIIELDARSAKGEFSGLSGGKKGRVASLIPLYRQGLIFHNEHNCGPLEKQLLSFPKSKRWDIMDAAAYINEILERGLRYFTPRDLMDKEGYDIEDEYRELEKSFNDEPLDYERFDNCPSWAGGDAW